MEYVSFFNSLTRADKERLADLAGVSVDYLGHVAYGHRKASADLSIVIERESGGRVRCESLRPGVDWTYIRGTAKNLGLDISFP